mmetsp:Transcript_55426/g.144606  ORF Transcript_55426/g.144606 Transcript_55426/m.144606 type:complete len:202 (-) Transcript_55426:216-821(-)
MSTASNTHPHARNAAFHDSDVTLVSFPSSPNFAHEPPLSARTSSTRSISLCTYQYSCTRSTSASGAGDGSVTQRRSLKASARRLPRSPHNTSKRCGFSGVSWMSLCLSAGSSTSSGMAPWLKQTGCVITAVAGDANISGGHWSSSKVHEFSTPFSLTKFHSRARPLAAAKSKIRFISASGIGQPCLYTRKAAPHACRSMHR